MKIMTIFIDMISGEKLNLCNSNAERTELDDFIEKFGGTLYANCYTPAPDTPRSAGCMWTGLYPKENGCKYRTRYPMFYMDEEKENIWSVLKKQNYNIQAFMRAPTLATGVLPKCVEENVYPDGNDLDGFLDSIRLQDNTFIMIYLPDFHTYLDIFQASIGGVRKGGAFVRRLLEKIFGKTHLEEYDHVLLFSDHGFRMKGETHRHLLEEDRVQTLMLWRKKGQSALTVDEKLRSNLDVFPTICEMINYTPEGDIDGKSLSGEGQPKYLDSQRRGSLQGGHCRICGDSDGQCVPLCLEGGVLRVRQRGLPGNLCPAGGRAHCPAHEVYQQCAAGHDSGAAVELWPGGVFYQVEKARKK